MLKVSAKTGKGVHKLLPVLADAIERYHRRVPTRDVNKVIAEAQQAQPAPGGARVLYALQGAADPPTFTLFVEPRAAAASTCATSSASSARRSGSERCRSSSRVRRRSG